MNPDRTIASLLSFPQVLRSLLCGLSDDEVRFRPEPGTWSINEILGHLIEEEIHDFRIRLRSTLNSPQVPWDPIDPPEAVRAGKYQDADPAVLLFRFESERSDSLVWLTSLRDADWTVTHHHPKVGPVQAGLLLVNWADHDMLHARQIIKRRHQLLVEYAGEYPTDYAGEWKA